MTEDERQAILEDAYSTLERVQYTEPRSNDPNDDALVRWRNGMPKPEPVRERKLDTVLVSTETEPDWSGWNAWLKSHLDIAIAEHREFQGKVIVGLIAQVQSEHEAELKEQAATLKEQAATLVREANLQRECAVKELKADIAVWRERVAMAQEQIKELKAELASMRQQHEKITRTFEKWQIKE
jgi:hypothetical protein